MTAVTVDALHEAHRERLGLRWLAGRPGASRALGAPAPDAGALVGELCDDKLGRMAPRGLEWEREIGHCEVVGEPFLIRQAVSSLLDNSIHIRCRIGDLATGNPVKVFGAPLRMCPGPGLRGRKFGLRYAIRASNMRSPAQGRLRLLFR